MALMPFFDDGTQGAVFDAGIEQLIAAVLVSPEFLYRSIHVPAVPVRVRSVELHREPAASSAAYPLTDLELATRLSYFLWSQGPDETLLDDRGRRKAGRRRRALQAQAARMLKDPRASRLVRNFALRALDLDKLHQVVPDPEPVPDVQRCAAARHGHRDRVVHRQHPARGPQHRRPAHGRPHVRQRAARQALRHPVGLRSAVPARDARPTSGAGA